MSKIRFKKSEIFTALAIAFFLAALLLWIRGIKPYIVLSGSMEPEIKTGSLCFVNTKAEFSRVRVGDIITYENPAGGMVTHRAAAICEAGIETKGDANDVSDGISVTEENFRGRIVWSVPYAGYVCRFLQRILRAFEGRQEESAFLLPCRPGADQEAAAAVFLPLFSSVSG